MANTPSTLTNSRFFAGFLALSPLLVLNVAIAYLLNAVTPLLASAAIGTFACSAFFWWRPLTRIAANAREGLLLEKLRKELAVWHGNRLCIAAHHVSGNTIAVAYSDGTAKGRFPAAPALRGPYRPPASRGAGYEAEGDARAAAARLLDPLVRAAPGAHGTTLSAILRRFGDTADAVLMHACRAAVLWGLVEATDRRDDERLYALISRSSRPSGSEAAAVGLRRTSAGQVWLDCGEGALREAGRRRGVIVVGEGVVNRAPPAAG